jgi:NADPH2:quinone reductase
MKAAVYSQNGGPEVFSYKNVEDPVVKANDVLIKVEAISIEGGDLSNRKLATPPTADYIVGYAAAGEVIELGAEVTEFKIGQKVLTFSWAGSHAELRAVDASTTFAIPEGMDLQLAIASFIGVATAALAIQLSGVQSGDTALVTGATGGVGNAVIQILANEGIKVFASGRSEATLEKLKDFGVSETIVVGQQPIHEQVRAIKEEGVDVFIDTVGSEILIDGIQSVKDGGKVVLIAGRAGAANFIDPIYILSHRLTVIGCLLGVIMKEPFVRDIIKKSLAMVANGEVKVPIHQTFQLADVVNAHREAEAGGKFGRIIITP